MQCPGMYLTRLFFFTISASKYGDLATENLMFDAAS
jgi:hypothetical protein